MAISEKRFGDLCDTVARIDERTKNTADTLDGLADKVDETRQAVPVVQTRLDKVEQDTRDQWTGINSVRAGLNRVKKPAKTSALVAGGITTLGGTITAIIIFWEKIQALFSAGGGTGGIP